MLERKEQKLGSGHCLDRVLGVLRTVAVLEVALRAAPAMRAEREDLANIAIDRNAARG